VRTERRPAEADAQAERLFRDFKMGLLTLVIVALLLLAYFWDGGGSNGKDRDQRDDVLSFSVTATRRAELVAPAVPEPPRRAVAPRPAAPGIPRRAAAPARDAGGGGGVYTVRPGDTLSGIALRYYGNASLWRTILEANRARLRRPADLRPGMKLVVPPRPGESADRQEGLHGPERDRSG
jgi:hypothetical protein